jgi:hypothetical protein
MGKDKFKICVPVGLKEWLIDDYDLVMHQNKVNFSFLLLQILNEKGKFLKFINFLMKRFKI